MSRTVHKTCNLCEAACGLLVEVEAGRVASIRPDKDDVFSRGHICPKAFALREVHEDPDRLRTPLRRTARGFEEIGWDEALAEAAGRLAALQRRDGRGAVATYIGNPVAHSFSTGLGVLGLVAAVGSRARFSTNSLDSNPRLLASLLLYGSVTAIPVPDLDRTRHLLIFGANPIVSNGSIVTAPGIRARLRAIQARGGRIVVVDPRRSETAEIADEHVFIRPGDDALVLAALLRIVLDEDLGRAGPTRVRMRVRGLDALHARLRPFDPERVAGATGIDAATLRRLARDFAAAPSAVAYGRTGTCNQAFGGLATFLIDALNIATGNLDREGGAMFSTPAVDVGGVVGALGLGGHYGRWRSRVRGAPELNDEIPAACFAEEVLTPGPGRVRGLVTIAANPALSAPNGREVERALADLETFVAVDIYVNETTRHAHLILPPAWSLEQEGYEALAYLVTVRDVAKLSPPCFKPGPGMRRDFEVLGALAAGIAARRSGLIGRWTEIKARALLAGLRALGLAPTPRRLLDTLLRIGPHALATGRLARAPHGIDLGPLRPRLGQLLKTASGGIDLDAPPALADLDRLARRLAGPPAPAADLVLVGRRDVRTNNSWGHNAPSLAAGRPRCTLLVNPADASRLGLADGKPARLKGRAGEVVVPVEVSDEMMPGVVSLPHGWGHDREGARLSVASRQPGASVNDVTDEREIDPLSGNAVLNGVPVEVRPEL